MEFKFFNNNDRNSSESIPIPSTVTEEFDKVLFIQGWLAYQRGVNIFECPYAVNESKRMWEYGYTQSYVLLRLPSDEDLYLTGWTAARSGYPSHTNPYLPNSNPHTVWNTGWNDFVNSH